MQSIALAALMAPKKILNGSTPISESVNLQALPQMNGNLTNSILSNAAMMPATSPILFPQCFPNSQLNMVAAAMANNNNKPQNETPIRTEEALFRQFIPTSEVSQQLTPTLLLSNNMLPMSTLGASTLSAATSENMGLTLPQSSSNGASNNQTSSPSACRPIRSQRTPMKEITTLDDPSELDDFMSQGEEACINDMKQFITQFSLRQTTVAMMTGVSQPYISKLLNGNHRELSLRCRKNIYSWYLNCRRHPEKLASFLQDPATRLETNGEGELVPQRRERYVFRPVLIKILETFFLETPFPDFNKRVEIATACNNALQQDKKGVGLMPKEVVSPQVVANWFANKRKEMRRKSNEDSSPSYNPSQLCGSESGSTPSPSAPQMMDTSSTADSDSQSVIAEDALDARSVVHVPGFRPSDLSALRLDLASLNPELAAFSREISSLNESLASVAAANHHIASTSFSSSPSHTIKNDTTHESSSPSMVQENRDSISSAGLPPDNNSNSNLENLFSNPNLLNGLLAAYQNSLNNTPMFKFEQATTAIE
uniref:Homeobox domain-containing protein n=1 Tax=Acrobeloides nanus TaxID=290746 RepID=A0A914CEF8_9BILA